MAPAGPPTPSLPHKGGGSSIPQFQQLQYAFAAHLREPNQHPAPAGIEDRRLKIYRELFYNNIESFIRNGFPVLRKLYDDARWQALVRDFYHRHLSHSPQFCHIGREFLEYLQQERGAVAGDPPFLLELAHYEWVEAAVAIDDTPLPAYDPLGDLLGEAPVLSPLARHLAYRFPVHRIGPDYRPPNPPETATYLVVVRNREDQVRFVELTPVTSRLMTLLGQYPARSGREHLLALAEELRHPDPQTLLQHGRVQLEQLREQSILLGTRPSP